MKTKYVLFLYLILNVTCILSIPAQKVIGNLSINNFLNNVNFNNSERLYFDTIRYKTSFIVLPREPGDKLIKALRNTLLKDNKDFKSLTNKGFNLEDQLEVKSYAKSSFISIVQKRYYENSRLHNMSFSTDCYNFLYHKGIVYEILLNSDKALSDSINSIVKRTFDKDCLLNEELSNKYQIFFSKGKQYINNPFNSRVCNDSLFIPNILNKIHIVAWSLNNSTKY